MATNLLSKVTPTWALQIKEEYNVNISPSKHMRREYYLFSPTPVLQYRLDFQGLSEENYRILQQHYRNVSGQFGAFHWQSIPRYCVTDIMTNKIKIGSLFDGSPFENNAIVSGTSLSENQDNTGWALDYDGVDDYSAATCPSTAFSYTAWIHPKEELSSATHYQILIHKYLGGTSHGLYVERSVYPNKFILNYQWSGDTISTTSYDISNYNSWYFLAGTYSVAAGSLPLLYVNGSNVATGAILNNISPVTMTLSSVSIGGGIAGKYLNATIGECRIYNKELSAASINTIYSGGSITAGLIGKWNCRNDDVSMYGRWANNPEIKINSRSFDVGMIFEKDI